MIKIKRLSRYLAMYGLGLVIFKIIGRTRARVRLPFLAAQRDVGVIGCGQYSFAIIGYFVWRKHGARFRKCYDIKRDAAFTFANFYSAEVASTAEEIFEDPAISHVIIASNHASHASYAVAALLHEKTVYVEKPVAVSLPQLACLKAAVARNPQRIVFGFNRPFSKAISLVKSNFPEKSQPLTLSCFITGHVIGPDHWYRLPQEGTRICGNIAHWLDLAVHILSWRDLPDRWSIALSWASENARDDNLAISLTSARGDLVSIVMTSRDEPFEGINENINLQVGALIAKIDDFREVKIWSGEHYAHHRIWPKDVGHRNTILQLFDEPRRAWDEIEASALLTLHIKNMVESAIKNSEFSFSTAKILLNDHAPSSLLAH